MNAAAILAAIRGVLLGDLGSVRVVAAGTVTEGVPAQLPVDFARQVSAVAVPTFDVEIDPPLRTGDVGPPNASHALLSVPIRITLTYTLDPVSIVSTTQRRAVRALAVSTANTIVQALEWPRNVEVDGDLNETGIIAGGLRARERPVIKRESWTTGNAGILELELRFEALVLETRAVA